MPYVFSHLRTLDNWSYYKKVFIALQKFIILKIIRLAFKFKYLLYRIRRMWYGWRVRPRVLGIRRGWTTRKEWGHFNGGNGKKYDGGIVSQVRSSISDDYKNNNQQLGTALWTFVTFLIDPLISAINVTLHTCECDTFCTSFLLFHPNPANT